MSQEISTVLGSCGLMVGLNMAPPPPGPMTRKSSGPVSKSAGQAHYDENCAKKMEFHRIMWLIACQSSAQPLQFTHTRSCLQLESDSQPQTNGPLAEHGFLLETICQLAKKRIDVDVRSCNRQHRSRGLVDPDVKVPQL